MASLCGSLYGVQSMAAILGVHHITVRKWISGVRPIPLARIPQLAALAREQAAALEALAVRLETVDRPVLEERRRIVRQRQRQTFFDALGFWPEENQVMRRQPPPTTGPKRERWAARRERAAARKGGL